MNDPTTLLLPVENQVRELDAKLLLACVAARRGYRCVIGWRGALDARIGRFPPSVYLAKSYSAQNTKMLRLNRALGHVTIAWDEEALVHYPPDIYYARRVGARALALVDVFIAWGADNEELLRGHPAFRDGDIRIAGNPRIDLLQPPVSEYFAADARALRDRYGRFVLVNTNFGSVNAYADSLNLVQSAGVHAADRPLGRGAIGMPGTYARGLSAHRSAIYAAFQALIPIIARALPEETIIVRPHPSENHAFWRAALSGLANVQVSAAGNVVPWLMSSACLLHNGCTTAIEATLLGIPVISYVPVSDPRYDFSLPNRLGVTSASPVDAIEQLRRILAGRTPPPVCAATNALLRTHIETRDGELAADRIIDVAMEQSVRLRKPGWLRPAAIARAQWRWATKRAQQLVGVARYRRGFVEQRFPDIEVGAVQERVDRLCRLTGCASRIEVRAHAPKLFELGAAT